jgi:hypothetical protein
MTEAPADGQGSLIADNFSLVSGGPAYRALRRVGLFAPRHNTRRVVVWLALIWLPLLILSSIEGMAWGNKVKIPLIHDYSIYCRFLIALPLLIAAESVIDPFIRRAVSTFHSSGIIKQDELPAYHAALGCVARWRDSGLIELLLAVVAWVPYFVLLAEYEWVSNQVSVWHGTTSQGLSPAGWWFVLIASPALRFLMLRWLWRYALWIYLLRQVSKLNLYLLPTHPDRVGGLGFLLLAQQQFAVLSAGLGSVVAGQFANEVLYFGGTLDGVRAPTVVFIVISVLIILFPLTLFSLKLFELRRDGLVRYSVVAMGITGRFDDKWVEEPESPPQAMLGSQDPSSLIDYISSYDVIQQTQFIPMDRRALLYIVILSAAPFTLVWLLTTPLDKLIGEILKKLL